MIFTSSTNNMFRHSIKLLGFGLIQQDFFLILRESAGLHLPKQNSFGHPSHEFHVEHAPIL